MSQWNIEVTMGDTGISVELANRTEIEMFAIKIFEQQRLCENDPIHIISWYRASPSERVFFRMQALDMLKESLA